ncbi:hypothetical protein [Cryptosporangium sp. NPDC051539]|uniref:hypothetical protein n=1 Tax=Cryptosporangium sp. NPDC051539 TaxID=3363962 RepID=UPI0037A86E32
MGTNRFLVYLSSRKNIVGCVGGLAGLGLGAAGFGGAWWWVMAVGLYAAGALATPSERVRLVVAGDSSEDAAAVRADLASLVKRVDAVSGRLPAGALERVRETAELLLGVLDRPAALAGVPDQAYAVSRVVRSDLPTSLESYLALPRWYGGGRPSAELMKQLDLIRADTRRVAEAVYAADEQRLADHTRYLEERGDRPNPLEGP